ncbi:MAG: hypothetical protein JNK05_36910 [Myxococcales bacterium]|nr:hypothetical protein [Myxococcales bacterium]
MVDANDAAEPPALAALTAARAAYQRGETRIDLDGDGRAEWVLEGRVGNGRPTRETIDSSNAGSPDMVWDRTGAVHSFRLDRNRDGRPEFVIESRVSTSNPALYTHVVSEDTDADNTVDLRRTFTPDPAQPTVAVQYELDDGSNRWMAGGWTTMVPNRQRRVTAQVPTTGAGACTPAQAAQIQSALDAALSKGTDCLNRMDSSLALQFARKFAASDVRIDCAETDPSSCGWARLDEVGSGWFGSGDDDVHVSLGPASFAAPCPALEQTLFHELMHFVLGAHSFGDGSSDTGDRIWGCEAACFLPSPTSLHCAQCLGALNGTPRCGSSFSMRSCAGMNVSTVCKSTGTLYPSAAACAAACAGSCAQRGPCGPRRA